MKQQGHRKPKPEPCVRCGRLVTQPRVEVQTRRFGHWLVLHEECFDESTDFRRARYTSVEQPLYFATRT